MYGIGLLGIIVIDDMRVSCYEMLCIINVLDPYVSGW